MDKFYKSILNASYGSNETKIIKYSRIKLPSKNNTKTNHMKYSLINNRK